MKKTVICIAFVICICLPSCGNKSKKNRVLDEVSMFSCETINLPAILTQIMDHETSSFIVPEENAKMVFWFDSTSCSTCNAKRLSYLDRIYQLSEENGKFEVLLIMSPRVAEVEELITILSLYDLDHPVCIDVDQRFMKNNPHLMEYPHCHFFLMDSSGHPQFIGNPVDSDQLWELFIDVVKSL